VLHFLRVCCMEHAAHCPVQLYSIFAHYLIKGEVLERKLFNINYESETFLILRRTKRVKIKYVYWSSCKVHVIFVRF
jgi:hypothetical protein